MTYLVTGGTGSLGSRLVRHILASRAARKVIVYSRGEPAQVELARSLADPRVRYILGDVRNGPALRRALRGVDVCIHTAALKHVDKAEYAPAEYIDVNVNGTLSVIEACDRANVGRCVFVSTDKAVQPVNLYGATKMCAERSVLAACAQNRNIYTVVRYGNVLDSRGSALNLFRDLALAGATALPVTDEAMTRFAMTFAMAVNLIDRAIDGPPQVVYVAKAKSFTVRDLCYAMDKRIDRKGPRPGEKMHETLISRYEAPYTSDWGDHYRIAPRTPADDEVSYAGGEPVQAGWEYTSGLTHERLTVEELKTWCDSIH